MPQINYLLLILPFVWNMVGIGPRDDNEETLVPQTFVPVLPPSATVPVMVVTVIADSASLPPAWSWFSVSTMVLFFWLLVVALALLASFPNRLSTNLGRMRAVAALAALQVAFDDAERRCCKMATLKDEFARRLWRRLSDLCDEILAREIRQDDDLKRRDDELRRLLSEHDGTVEALRRDHSAEVEILQDALRTTTSNFNEASEEREMECHSMVKCHEEAYLHEYRLRLKRDEDLARIRGELHGCELDLVHAANDKKKAGEEIAKLKNELKASKKACEKAQEAARTEGERFDEEWEERQKELVAEELRLQKEVRHQQGRADGAEAVTKLHRREIASLVEKYHALEAELKAAKDISGPEVSKPALEEMETQLNTAKANFSSTSRQFSARIKELEAAKFALTSNNSVLMAKNAKIEKNLAEAEKSLQKRRKEKGEDFKPALEEMKTRLKTTEATFSTDRINLGARIRELETIRKSLIASNSALKAQNAEVEQGLAEAKKSLRKCHDEKKKAASNALSTTPLPPQLTPEMDLPTTTPTPPQRIPEMDLPRVLTNQPPVERRKVAVAHSRKLTRKPRTHEMTPQRATVDQPRTPVEKPIPTEVQGDDEMTETQMRSTLLALQDSPHPELYSEDLNDAPVQIEQQDHSIGGSNDDDHSKDKTGDGDTVLGDGENVEVETICSLEPPMLDRTVDDDGVETTSSLEPLMLDRTVDDDGVETTSSLEPLMLDRTMHTDEDVMNDDDSNMDVDPTHSLQPTESFSDMEDDDDNDDAADVEFEDVLPPSAYIHSQKTESVTEEMNDVTEDDVNTDDAADTEFEDVLPPSAYIHSQIMESVNEEMNDVAEDEEEAADDTEMPDMPQQGILKQLHLLKNTHRIKQATGTRRSKPKPVGIQDYQIDPALLALGNLPLALPTPPPNTETVTGTGTGTVNAPALTPAPTHISLVPGTRRTRAETEADDNDEVWSPQKPESDSDSDDGDAFALLRECLTKYNETH
ncbi:hypothetical protein MMC19_006772 [Ptychographa xylographoides]|nr:hypothetical protein [Ptychographa xylographoides]